jgi:hypothetical protein
MEPTNDHRTELLLNGQKRVLELVADAAASQLRSVLQNLLGYAWKFTSQQAAAKIEFGRITHNGSPAFFVRDNGVGFNMAYADKLFARSSGCTPPRNFPARASARPPSSASFTATAAESGPKANQTRRQPSISRCPTPKEDNQILKPPQ